MQEKKQSESHVGPQWSREQVFCTWTYKIRDSGALKDCTGEEIALGLERNKCCIVQLDMHLKQLILACSLRNNDEMMVLENLTWAVHEKLIINKCWPYVLTTSVLSL